MERNELTMFMDTKLDIHDKREITLRLKAWTRCQIKIEAVKCVPCFLRISFQDYGDKAPLVNKTIVDKCFTISVNVPGVNVSLANSRTKQYSYGLFWTQNRRDCFIYFALDTEDACRRHMKWLKKSIKNLELHRQLFLEQRRLSRVVSRDYANASVFGPLPSPPMSLDASRRVSEIYEEIYESDANSRLSQRYSRSSIASGIYEEMKPSTHNFNAIMEEPPALPPLPTQRKRINTFQTENDQAIGEIRRANTNPESELAKKKKYRNVLENLFGGGRQKRAISVSECEKTPDAANVPIYIHAFKAPKSGPLKEVQRCHNLALSQRNSFSSPDLSKIHCVGRNEDTLDGASLNLSLDESVIEFVAPKQYSRCENSKLRTGKSDSLESLNISSQLPNNFNFSACNTSTMNLIGAHGAVPATGALPKNEIIVDDLTGYCVMAPIQKKTATQIEKKKNIIESGSSGYSTSSHCSSTSSCNTEEQQRQQQLQQLKHIPTNSQCRLNESAIYEPMHGNMDDSKTSTVSGRKDVFAEHLYENLLTIKATQELEQPAVTLSTSTPTDSPQIPDLPIKQPKTTHIKNAAEIEEDHYQTPRKSIISVDEKVPSYYPNSCDTLKTKRCSRSPEQQHQQKLQRSNEKTASEKSHGICNLLNSKVRRDHKDLVKMIHIDTPTSRASSSKLKALSKKTAARKISEHVYAVTHINTIKQPASEATTPTSIHKIAAANNNNSSSSIDNNNEVVIYTPEMGEQIEAELLQLAMLQNIDFKFDDSKPQLPKKPSLEPTATLAAPTGKPECYNTPTIMTAKSEAEYEHCYQAAEHATHLLQKYATLAKFCKSPFKQTTLTVQSKTPQEQEQLTPTTVATTTTGGAELQGSGAKKFTSLPRFKKIDFSPLKQRINNVLQRNQ